MIVRPADPNSLAALIRNENIAVARINGTAVLREMQRSVPVFDDINYRVEHNLESDVGRFEGCQPHARRSGELVYASVSSFLDPRFAVS